MRAIIREYGAGAHPLMMPYVTAPSLRRPPLRKPYISLVGNYYSAHLSYKYGVYEVPRT